MWFLFMGLHSEPTIKLSDGPDAEPLEDLPCQDDFGIGGS